MAMENSWVAMLLPRDIRTLSDEDLIEGIKEIKEEYGERLVILGHHYQRKEIVHLSDYRGDSLALARRAASLEKAEFIVFCGVEFMVETAAMLCRPEQVVIHPAPNAGCPLADMATLADVTRAWGDIASVVNIKRVIPITYVNSSSEIKAFCGERDGIICTSSNAKEVIEWALGQGERFLFMPDENLGRNSCNALEIPRDRMVVWDQTLPSGGCDAEAIQRSKAILWKGYCHVHTDFTLQQVKLARENYAGCRVVVHPECPEEVVDAADANGSTAFIVKYVEDAPADSTIVIGTEINLVSRLADENPDKKVVELSCSPCPDMAQVNLRNLYWALKNIGKVNVIEVDERIKASARVALERMLAIK